MAMPAETVPRPTDGAWDSGTVTQIAGQGAGHSAGQPGTPTLKELAAQVLARAEAWDSVRDTFPTTAREGCPAPIYRAGQIEPSSWRAMFEERAAIREHDGGMSRDESEAAALADIATRWRAEHPLPASPQSACMHCGAPVATAEAMPVLAARGHAWLHDRCWAPMDVARRAQALAAVRALLEGDDATERESGR